MNDARVVLDPWSGTGTTAAVCLKRGISSVSIDINPALTIIARARLVPIQMHSKLIHDSNNILETAESIEGSIADSSDAMNTWVFPIAIQKIRAIRKAIGLVQSNANTDQLNHNTIHFVDEIPYQECFFLLCIVLGCKTPTCSLQIDESYVVEESIF